MVPLCKYILQDDQQCEQAAIKGGHYCRHHQVIRKSVAAAEDQNAAAQLPFRFPSDHASQLYNYFLLIQALNEGRLSLKAANVMIRLLKACDASLKGAILEVVARRESSSEDEQIAMESEQADQDVEATDEETIKLAAARESARERKERVSEPVSKPAPQKREPLDLLRHSRGMAGRGRRRR